VIVHGENGFSVARSHLHKLGEAVLDVLAMSREDKMRVSQAAREYVLTHHSITQEKELLQTVVNRLIPNSL
jgi:L-malate glycosyltransferase